MSYIDDSGESRPMFGGGRRGSGEGRRGGRGGGFNLAEMISTLDADGDGKMQKSEAPERLRGFFAVMDSNGDGGIDTAEAEAAIDETPVSAPLEAITDEPVTPVVESEAEVLVPEATVSVAAKMSAAVGADSAEDEPPF